MATPSGIQSGVGFRHCQIFALDGDGYPVSSTSGSPAYAGVTISGAKVLTLNDPEPRQVVHTGDDRPILLDTLPPTEPISGELRSSKSNFTVDAIVSGTAAFTLGEKKFMGIGTNQRGNEPLVGMVAYRQTLDSDPGSATFGKRLWDCRIIPKAFLITRENSFDENPEERMYTVRPQFSVRHLWGDCFDVVQEGFSQAQGLRGVSEYKPQVAGWIGDGTTDTFALPTGVTAVLPATKTQVWVDGTIQTSGVTPGTASIVFDSPPAVGVKIIALYEVLNEADESPCD